MYPSGKLKRLARHKAALRKKSTSCRAHYVGAATRVAQPLAQIDEALLVWRQLSPIVRFAAASIGLLLHRTAHPRPRLPATLLRWGPVVVAAARLGADLARSTAPAVESANGRR